MTLAIGVTLNTNLTAPSGWKAPSIVVLLRLRCYVSRFPPALLCVAKPSMNGSPDLLKRAKSLVLGAYGRDLIIPLDSDKLCQGE